MMRYGWLCLLVAWANPPMAADTLQEQLRELAQQRGFQIEGLGRLGDEPSGNAEGSSLEQVRHLLQDFNYLVTQSRPGVIATLRIISRRGESKGTADGAYVKTRRVGAHHQVDATLIGPNGIALTLPLMVDTGATTLVLPTSRLADLGFTSQDLRKGASQTAGGVEPIQLGRLRHVRIGGVSAADVEVSFIPDAKLSGNQLLGMSFLQRFKMTIDDANSELILMAR